MSIEQPPINLEPTENIAEQESERVALEKLHKLMSDDCTKFAVRFMNVTEYEAILTAKGGMYWSEVNFYNTVQYPKEEKPLNFKQWLGEQTNHWARTAEDHTHWRWSLENLQLSEELTKKFQELRAQEHDKKKAMKQFRDYVASLTERSSHFKHPIQQLLETGKEFQESQKHSLAATNELEEMLHMSMDALDAFVASVVKEYPVFRSGSRYDPQYMISDFLAAYHLDDDAQKRAKSLLDDLVYRAQKINLFGQERLQLMNDFFTDESFLEIPGNLRKLFHALTTVPRANMPGNEYRQYHIAMIFDLSGIKGYTPVSKNPSQEIGKRDWGRIEGKQAHNILGAISCLPQKELFNEMVRGSKVAGEAAHPVFDSAGRVRWPAEKKN